MVRVVYGSEDRLFGSIEENQGDRPFGRFLDAGTGVHSISWIASLVKSSDNNGITDFTAVTADDTMRKNVQERVNQFGIQESGSVVVTNWMSDDMESACATLGTYDTILADYLVGAMDGFSPYRQDLIFPKLSSLLKPGGRIYVVGLEPIPDKAVGGANVICKVRQVRDACILLAGHRCYREYPQTWIERHLEGAGLKVVKAASFPILYSHKTIVRQINVGRSKFPYFPTQGLKEEMRVVLDRLEQESKEETENAPNGKLRLGFDYVITAEKIE